MDLAALPRDVLRHLLFTPLLPASSPSRHASKHLSSTTTTTTTAVTPITAEGVNAVCDHEGDSTAADGADATFGSAAGRFWWRLSWEHMADCGQLGVEDWVTLLGVCRAWRTAFLRLLAEDVTHLDLSLGNNALEAYPYELFLPAPPTTATGDENGDGGPLCPVANDAREGASKSSGEAGLQRRLSRSTTVGTNGSWNNWQAGVRRPQLLGARMRRLAPILRHLPNLQVLVLDDCTRIDPDDVVLGIEALVDAQQRDMHSLSGTDRTRHGLRVLSLRNAMRELHGKTDVIGEMLAFCGQTLRVLDTRGLCWTRLRYRERNEVAESRLFASECVARWLSNAPDLEELYLWNAVLPRRYSAHYDDRRIDVAAQHGFGRRLRVLDLWGSDVPGLAELLESSRFLLPQLHTLDISECPLTHENFAELPAALPDNLHTLRFRAGDRRIAEGLEFRVPATSVDVSCFRSISRLCLREHRRLPAETLLFAISQARNTLCDLDLGAVTAVDEPVLAAILELVGPRLERLMLWGTRAVNDHCIQLVAAKCSRSLDELELWSGFAGSLSDSTIDALARSPCKLSRLNLRGNSDLGQEALRAFLERPASQFRMLNLALCDKLEQLPEPTILSNIEDLDLHLCSALQAPLSSLVEARSIWKLDVTEVQSITDDDLLHLENCVLLSCVCFHDCARITAAGVVEFAKRGRRGRPHLSEFSVRGCGPFREKRLLELARWAPNLTEVALDGDLGDLTVSAVQTFVTGCAGLDGLKLGVAFRNENPDEEAEAERSQFHEEMEMLIEELEDEGNPVEIDVTGIFDGFPHLGRFVFET